ncbi:hypothetical protein N7462_007224 [Penicillium macrosclerotiorum]|uniref:uncharacterized protein n=1 Tax=Penicillium macrosclerotiorum TaxID=303699 RepID=UPI0025473D07|nr:uncharacterized protein N7462_007224 [Penicillium macrosclerotiorum]KAJ5678980.1 hypothetical protein N7462_007224 [Penicillium macrosclerotiorum]
MEGGGERKRSGMEGRGLRVGGGKRRGEDEAEIRRGEEERRRADHDHGHDHDNDHDTAAEWDRAMRVKAIGSYGGGAVSEGASAETRRSGASLGAKSMEWHDSLNFYKPAACAAIQDGEYIMTTPGRSPALGKNPSDPSGIDYPPSFLSLSPSLSSEIKTVLILQRSLPSLSSRSRFVVACPEWLLPRLHCNPSPTIGQWGRLTTSWSTVPMLATNQCLPIHSGEIAASYRQFLGALKSTDANSPNNQDPASPMRPALCDPEPVTSRSGCDKFAWSLRIWNYASISQSPL